MNIMSGIDPESRPFRAETGANGEPRALLWAIAYGPFGAEDGLPADGVRVGMSCVDVVCGRRVWTSCVDVVCVIGPRV
jgi:hypothetical protein